jgi:toxin CptA
MITTGIFASLIFNLWRVIPNRPGAIVMIALSEGGTLNIQDRRGHWFECRALSSTYVSQFLVVLDLRKLENEMIKRVVILPDMVDPEDFRTLRVWLRWKAKSTEQESIGHMQFPGK